MSGQTVFRDTIFALSSGGLPAGVAVIRMSGAGTRNALSEIAGSVPEPRRAQLSSFRSATGDILDRGLALFFPGPQSFTGEDCAELQCHGGRAVVAALLETLGTLGGFRHAESGEFTRRAFLNGKLDLTSAEALGDLVAAETEAQRRFAQANSDGRHRRLYQDWRERLIRARALIEAEIDFSDEGDVPGSVAESVWQDVEALRQEIAAHAAGYRAAEIVREGFRVVILGAPNAGKSSLINALAKRDVAIVTEEPGTTRDVLEVALDIRGLKVILADTAGIRQSRERVEAIGVQRAMDRAREADLVLLLEDVVARAPIDYDGEAPVLRVGSKGDLLAPDTNAGGSEMVTSAKTGAGLSALLERIASIAEEATGDTGDTLPFRARHVALLQGAGRRLESAVTEGEAMLELRAEDLRLASDALGRISGAIDVEDLLDTVFGQFCIGK